MRFYCKFIAFSFFIVQLRAEVVADSTNTTTIYQDANKTSQETQNKAAQPSNLTNTININGTIINVTNANILNIPLDGEALTPSKPIIGPECVIERGWFRRNIHLQTGHSWFSREDCSLEVCNESGSVDFYSCNRMDSWDVLRPTIEREVNEGQLQCLKTGCI